MSRDSINSSINVPVVELNRWHERLIGLMGKREISENSFYLFSPCNSIHTFHMKIPIDVVFLDQSDVVIKVCENINKNKLLSCKRAKKVIEGRVGLINHYSIEIGKKICW